MSSVICHSESSTPRPAGLRAAATRGQHYIRAALHLDLAIGFQCEVQQPASLVAELPSVRWWRGQFFLLSSVLRELSVEPRGAK